MGGVLFCEIVLGRMAMGNQKACEWDGLIDCLLPLMFTPYVSEEQKWSMYGTFVGIRD